MRTISRSVVKRVVIGRLLRRQERDWALSLATPWRDDAVSKGLLRDLDGKSATDEEEEDFFDMANLPPEATGLPMVVWVSQRGRAQHAARVKVSLIHGRRMSSRQMTSVSVRPTVEVVAGAPLSSEDLSAVRKWVAANEQAILDYWEERLFTTELIERLRRTSDCPPPLRVLGLTWPAPRSASCSGSPPGARATGRRSASSSTGCRRGFPLGARDPALAGPAQTGTVEFTTQRREPDRVEILSGVFEGVTTGTPVSMLIRNEDRRSKDYGEIKDVYRPGHADYTYDVKYGLRDYRGGGRSSARRPPAGRRPAPSPARSWARRSGSWATSCRSARTRSTAIGSTPRRSSATRSGAPTRTPRGAGKRS